MIVTSKGEYMDYFSSDQHFKHKNIIKYAGRPFTHIDAMHSDMISKHNSVVGPDDTWHCVGDFAFASIAEQKVFLSSLNGKKKILYLGNHDRTPRAMREIGFDEVYTKPVDWEYGGYKFRICHYPFAPEDHEGIKPRFMDRRPSPEGCDWLICGKNKEKWKIMRNAINVGVDVWDFYPSSIDTLIQTIKASGFNSDPKLTKTLYCY